MPEPTSKLSSPLAIAGIVGLFAVLGIGLVLVLAMVGLVSLPFLFLDSHEEPTLETEIADTEPAKQDVAVAAMEHEHEENLGETAATKDVYEERIERLLENHERRTGEMSGELDERGAEMQETLDLRTAEGQRAFLEDSTEMMDRYEQTAAQMQEDYERSVERLLTESERAEERLEIAEEREEQPTESTD